MEDLMAMEGLFTRSHILYCATFPDETLTMPSLEEVRKVTYANFGYDQAKYVIMNGLWKCADKVDMSRKVITLTPFWYKMLKDLKFIIYTVKVLKHERSTGSAEYAKGHAYRFNGGQNILEIRKVRDVSYLDATKELGFTVEPKSANGVAKRKSALKYATAELKKFIATNEILKKYVSVSVEDTDSFFDNEEDSVSIALIDFMTLDREAESDSIVAKYTGILLNGVSKINAEMKDKYPGFEITDDWDKYEGYLFFEAK